MEDTDFSIEDSFTAHPSGVGLLPEYARALSGVCVQGALLARSPLRDTVRSLATQPSSSNSADTILLSFIRHAWQLQSTHQAKHFTGTSEVVNGYVCFYDGCSAFLNALSWERSIAIKGLERIAATTSPYEMQLVCGLMVRASQECEARKRYVFNSIVTRCMPAHSRTPDNSLITGAVTVTSPLDAARARLYAVAAEYIEDIKIMAVKSTFYEPTVAYAEAMHYHIVSGDVDVHGVSAYLAGLLSSTGIRVSRIPTWNDGIMGMAHFLAAGMDAPLKLLWAPDRLGKSHRDVPGFLAAMGNCQLNTMPEHKCIWTSSTTLEFAKDAVNSSPRNARNRKAWAAYITQFATYFSEKNLLPRMFTAMANGHAGSEESNLQDFAIVLRDVMGSENLGVDDVRQSLWDLDGPTGAEFRFDVGRKLFNAIGITKECPARAELRYNLGRTWANLVGSTR